MYYRGDKPLKDEYLLLYVNVMLLIGKEKKKIRKMKDMLEVEFDTKDLGPTRKILGIRMDRNKQDGSLFLNQRQYLEKVIDKFEMKNAKPAKL